MKIALILSGQPRYLDEGYVSINENILSKYDVDCFAHIWWDEEMRGKKLEFHNSLTYGRTYFYKEDTLETIMSLYKPKAFIHQEQKKFDIYPGNYALANPLTTYSQWFSIMKTNELRNAYSNSASVEYDLVIRCRFDSLINKMDIELKDLLSNDNLYTQTVYSDGKYYATDQFAISSPKIMDKYCNLYNRLHEYYLNGQGKQKDGWVGERLITYHLEMENVQIKNLDPSKFNVDILKI